MIRRIIRSILKMMYTLTQEEYDNLVPASKLEIAEKALDWMRRNFVPRCGHHQTEAHGEKPYYYCTECPLSDTGKNLQLPHGRPTREISKAICPLRREYPK